MDRQPQSTTTTTLQQAAKLLEQAQQRLRTASQTEATNTTTAARVRQMPTAQLQRDPVLWAAYTRGWEDRTAVFRRATRDAPAAAMRLNRSRSPRRAVRATARSQPPPRPLMERPVPAPRATQTNTGTLPAPVAAPTETARQRRNKERLREFREKKRQASQQHRLEQPTATAPPNQTPPTTDDSMDTEGTVPEVTATSVTTKAPETFESMTVTLTPLTPQEVELLNTTWWTASPTSAPGSP